MLVGRKGITKLGRQTNAKGRKVPRQGEEDSSESAQPSEKMTLSETRAGSVEQTGDTQRKAPENYSFAISRRRVRLGISRTWPLMAITPARDNVEMTREIVSRDAPSICPICS